jgi:hypothetical protein
LKSKIKYIFSGILFLCLIGIGDNFLFNNSIKKDLIVCEWIDRGAVFNARKSYCYFYRTKILRSKINFNSSLKRYLRIFENLTLIRQNNQENFFNYIIKTKNTQIVLLTCKESLENYIIVNL